jgi:hypothetical protein
MENIFSFLSGALLALLSIYAGYTIGQREAPEPDELRRRVNKLFDKITERRETPGSVERPKQRDLDLYKDPKNAEEQKIMSEIFDNLIPKEK